MKKIAETVRRELCAGADLLEEKKIGIAGFGHLGSSIVSALLAHGFPRDRLLISHGGSAGTLERIRAAGLGCCVTDTAELMLSANIAVLAARPQDLLRFRGIETSKDMFILSFMAGVSLESLHKIFPAQLCRVMCSGPETIDAGRGIGVSFPSEALPRAVMEAAGLKVFDVSCESELDSFTVGICIPPIVLNMDISREEKDEAMRVMARRFPIYSELSGWIDEVVSADKGRENSAALANVSTKGGVTEAMVDALNGGASFCSAVEAGLARSRELRDDIKRKLAAAAA
ncbi:MAG: NAD(P)-binding domain-containing protein [Synergistes sp.]|nr:NAD(P)-binding domain-containing protein [Synergistes sp.]